MVPHNLPIPDYKETGFIGRAHEQKYLTDMCKSFYPVVGISGAPGVGKTSLALRAAYTLSDEESSGYTAVVWLEASDIQSRDSTRRTASHPIKEVAQLLSDPEPLNNILSYLNSNRVLLILDDLDSYIADDKIRSFLARANSKGTVLTTSRAPLGASILTRHLEAMADENAILLLRTAAQVRGVEQIARADVASLRRYCRKLGNNPLFIKSFLSALQAGKDQITALQIAVHLHL
jgi:hypothetical protein